MPLRHKKFVLALQPHEVSPNRTERSPLASHNFIAFCAGLILLMGLAFPDVGTLSISCTNGVCGQNSTTDITPWNASINATPNLDYSFLNFTSIGNCTLENASSNITTVLLLSGNCNLTANFNYTGSTVINASWAIGALDTGYFTSFGSWADVMNVTTTPAYAFLNCTVNTYRGAVLVKSVSQTNISNGNYSLASGTGLPEGYTYSVNATCFGSGASSSTETRTRTLIASSEIGGGEMAGEILILAGVALIYIAFKKEGEHGTG